MRSGTTHRLSRIYRFLTTRYTPRGARHSFSHAGEDLIMREALPLHKKDHSTYIDIGAHHPIFSNNTYLLYRNGGHGVIVEPNASLCELARAKRPRDIVVCAGAGPTDGAADFYAFSQSTRSTFSPTQAADWERGSGQRAEKKNLPLFSLDTIITKFLNNTPPDIVSIDAEGYDLDILRAFSWNTRPRIFCVESIEPSGKRNRALSELFMTHHYRIYAETPANTIFIDTLVQ